MEKKKSSYAWVIVAACFLLMFATTGIIINCASIFLTPVTEDLGFTRTGFSLCITLITVSLIVGGPVIAKLLGKVNLRLLMTVSGVITAAGYMGYAFCRSLPMFYVCSLIIGVGANGVATIPCAVMLNNWFVEKKGVATGIAFTGSGFGGMLFSQLSNRLIIQYGWSRAYFILGICMAAIVLPTTLFLVALSPADKGTTAYGAGSAGKAQNAAAATGISSGKYYKTKSFYMLAFTAFFIGIINLGVQGHIPAHLMDRGLSATFATSMVTLYMVSLIVGKLVLGAVYDKIGPVKGTAYAFIVYMAAMAVMVVLKTQTMGIIFALLFGLCNPMATVSLPYITSSIVGTKNYAAIYSIINLTYSVGMAIGTPLSAAIFDATGTYGYAFMAYIVIALVLIVTTGIAVKSGEGYSKISDQ